MRKLMSAAVLAAAVTFAGTALANSTMDATYGNTVTVTTAEGAVASYYMDANGTYLLTAGDVQVTGTWSTHDDQVCLTPAGGEEACSPLTGGKSVGDTWVGQASDGSEVTYAIVAGR